MNNFYKEHDGYVELDKILRDYSLDHKLLMVVGDAIQYGIDKLNKKLQEA